MSIPSSAPSAYTAISRVVTAAAMSGIAPSLAAATKPGTAQGGTSSAPPVWGPAAPATGTVSGVNSSKLGKNEFLKLLVAQLRNQDPLDVQKPEDMASQLAQFSTLEQMQELNQATVEQGKATVTALGQLATATQQQMYLGLVGMDALSQTPHINFSTADGMVSRVGVNADAGYGPATLEFVDAGGRVVGAQLVRLETGMNTIEINQETVDSIRKGIEENYKESPTAMLTMRVKRSNGSYAGSTTLAPERIGGVRFLSDGPRLLVGANSVKSLADLRALWERTPVRPPTPKTPSSVTPPRALDSIPAQSTPAPSASRLSMTAPTMVQVPLSLPLAAAGGQSI